MKGSICECLHPLNRVQPQNTHTVVQHLARRSIQGHTGLLNLRLAADHLQNIIAGAQHMCHTEQVAEHSDGLLGLGCVDQDIRPLSQQTAQIHRVLLSEEVEVGTGQLIDVQLRLAGHRAETSVSVLQIGASVTLKGGHGLQVELVVVDTKTELALRSFKS